MPAQSLRIATRKSALAVWQAEFVRQALIARFPELEVELVRMTTQGDRVLDQPLAAIGGKGLFIKELEEGMLDGRADLAVHSVKDIPARMPEGFILAAVPPRADPRDAFVSNEFARLDDLPRGARVGTSSLRRRSQIAERRPDLVIEELRGNVNTRLDKLDRGDFDAIILATAGLERLELGSRIRERLAPEILLPAVGQGAIGVECLAERDDVREYVAALNHGPTAQRVAAERAMNERLEGSCNVPLAGHAELAEGVLLLRGLVGEPDGSELIHGVISGQPDDGEALGRVLAEDLLSRGADRILASAAESAARRS